MKQIYDNKDIGEAIDKSFDAGIKEGYRRCREEMMKEDEEWCPPGGAFKFNLNTALYNFGKEVASKCLDTHILDESLNEYVTEDNVKEYVERYSKCIAKGVWKEMMKDAVEGEVYSYHSYNRDATAILVDISKENLGDKVRIIIIKEEENGTE